MPILFCNTAWMELYAGRRPDDPPRGGGGFVTREGWAGEECNFVRCRNGWVYGHFETIKKGTDRQVKISRLGAATSADFVDGVDVVWTAPFEGNAPRVVVGWWLDARVYRRRQPFNEKFPSDRHRRDQMESYIVRAKATNATLLIPADRDMQLKRGPGWSGQTSWWYADDTKDLDAQAFVATVKERIRPPGKAPSGWGGGSISATSGKASVAAASEKYRRYLETYETVVHPRHHVLQQSFVHYLSRRDPTVTFPAPHRDDLRYACQGQTPVMVEVKPTDPGTLRFAIRTAIGQLLDYRQHQHWTGRQLILVEAVVTNEDDRRLAWDNGFGLAWPEGEGDFKIVWSPRPSGKDRE